MPFVLKSKKKIPVQIQKDFIKEVAETIPEIKVNFA